MTYHILYQFNEKYAPFAGTSILSALCNNKDAEEICVWILGENLSQDSIDKLTEIVQQYERRIVFVKTDLLIEEMKKLHMPTYRGSYAANMRLFLPLVIPESITKLLYLDADTIVDGKLKKLFEIDLQDRSLGMVLDSLGESHKAEIGLRDNDGYYNSGVILFNLRMWRKKELTNRIVQHVQTVRNNYPSPDQDLLNVVCKNEIVTLSPRYNFQPIHLAFDDRVYFRYYAKSHYYGPEVIAKARGGIVIYHFFRFIGEFPWNKNNVHPDCKLFDWYLGLTPWKNYEKKAVNQGIVGRIEKFLYLVLPKSLFMLLFRLSHRVFYGRANRLSMKNQISKKM